MRRPVAFLIKLAFFNNQATCSPYLFEAMLNSSLAWIIRLPPRSRSQSFSVRCRRSTRRAQTPEVDKARYVQRLARGQFPHQELFDPAVPLRLESRERGHLDTLRFG